MKKLCLLLIMCFSFCEVCFSDEWGIIFRSSCESTYEIELLNILRKDTELFFVSRKTDGDLFFYRHDLQSGGSDSIDIPQVGFGGDYQGSYMVGEASMLITGENCLGLISDTGFNNWKMTQLKSGSFKSYKGDFYDYDLGAVALAEAGLLLTTNSAENWQYIKIPGSIGKQGAYSVTDAIFRDKENIMVNLVPLDPSLLEQDDCTNCITGYSIKDEKWEQRRSVDCVINSIRFISPDRGFIVGSSLEKDKSRILMTGDGGESWTIVLDTASDMAISYMGFYEGRKGIAGAGSSVWFTSDSGMTWQTDTGIGSFLEENELGEITHAHFINSDEIYLTTQGGGPCGRSEAIIRWRIDASSAENMPEKEHIHPNPSTYFITIPESLRGFSTMHIYDIHGMEHFPKVHENGMDISSLPAGAYTIILRYGESNRQLRFIKE